MKKLEKINKIKAHPDNPRVIRDGKFKLLVQSIIDFPEMLEKRPLVVNEDLQVLGGNMRLKAAKEAGKSEIWIDIAEGWSKEKQNEFIIKDNSGFGEWDWDALANNWDNIELKDWGLDIWQPEEDVSNVNDYSLDTAEEKLNRFLDAKIKNITIPFETSEFESVVKKLDVLLNRYKVEDYRALIYKIIENEKI